MRQRHLPLLLALLIPVGVMAGQVYEWKDATGKRHFSDHPPTGVDAKPMGIKTTAPKPSGPPAGGAAQNSEAQAPKTWAEKNEAFDKRQADKAAAEAEAKQKADEERRRSEACEQAKQQLKLLESGRRVQRMDANGERIVLDDAARAEEIARVKDNIQRACEKSN
ncbi:DUF4124 domain-containing protein [Nitrogeniibacter mangrovi]|uniref:DUF4124 domain-containing protein n=1 Tax=Nitrogeniibacter mangrovi TaxID=2016596 RepID=A0A6C1B2T4_9RHOO|nr:DUF4124 domain-containing protein [Nitrogeniibacter mangrovi]QID17961.1 DUF4124 domain-containing protein [Nitrogeniibacter mangrovi]